MHSGQTIVTKGKEAQAAIRLEDGTLILVAGDTHVTFSAEDRDRIDVELGNATAAVRPRPADRPLVFCTPEARIEVLGTRLSVARAERRTRVDVLEGDIRLTRLSDQRSVTLAGGQTADVSPQADLRPAAIQPVPDTWSLDFNDGLPPGWETGQLVFHDLPEGSRAAARTAAVEENGHRRYQLRSHNAWSKGLFTLHDDSWIHIRYRLEKPGTFLLYVVCRQHDFGEPVCTVLTPGNLPADRTRPLAHADASAESVPTYPSPRHRAPAGAVRGVLSGFRLSGAQPGPDGRSPLDHPWNACRAAFTDGGRLEPGSCGPVVLCHRQELAFWPSSVGR